MANSNPKISIITVVYNGADLLEGTIQSVVNQTYTNIEYLIVDGASKDGTLDIIQKYESKITKWISEPDKGLYDAMNKAIDLATGDFLWFMNTGDQILKEHTLEKMMGSIEQDTDVLFGEVMLVDEQRKHIGTRSELSTQKLPEQLDWKSLKTGMVVCHQGFLPRRSLVKKYMDNNLSADIDWVISILKKSRKNTNTKMIVAEYLMGGVSKQRHQQSLKDRYSILQKHYGTIPNFLNHIYIFGRAVLNKLQKGNKAY